MTRRRASEGSLLGALLAILGIALFASSAAAQSRRERAEALLRSGNQLHDRGDYKAALEDYRAAQRLFPSYKIEFNIGVTLQAMGHPLEALSRFESFLRQANTASDASKMELARRRIAKLRHEVSSIRLDCSVPGAKVWLDGELVGQVPLERELYVMPGQHQVRVGLSGFQTFEQTLSLEPGEHPTVTVRLAPREAARVRARPVRPPSPPPPAPAPRRRWLWSWVLSGAAVATLGVAVGFGVSARNDYNEYLATNSGKVWDEKHASIPKKALAANICYGVGGALAVGAAVLFFVEPRLAREQAGRKVGARLRLELGSGVGLSGSF